jgi:hypothetical protein
MADADALRHFEYFRVAQGVLQFEHIRSRAADYYLSLVGELFDRMRDGDADAGDWARLGNAFSQFASEGRERAAADSGISASDAALFGAAGLYFGGFPASAYVTMREQPLPSHGEAQRACFELLARPSSVTSQTVQALLNAVREGDLERIAAIETASRESAGAALAAGPVEWVPAKLLEHLTHRFRSANIRAVLPDGASGLWNPLVMSLLDRTPPAWEFFPSQIAAITGGLLDRDESYALQMPTGAGKTALCETLLFAHLQRRLGDAAILLVPYRSLASELRTTLVRRLNAMGLRARCAYGGTVPTGDEVRGLEDTRAMVATPEALSGLMSADSAFLRRTSLVVVDEGHLLDGGARHFQASTRQECSSSFLRCARQMACGSTPFRMLMT